MAVLPHHPSIQFGEFKCESYSGVSTRFEIYDQSNTIQFGILTYKRFRSKKSTLFQIGEQKKNIVGKWLLGLQQSYSLHHGSHSNAVITGARCIGLGIIM